MFDRLGRIDDETPFVLEWFVKHGIEVWSVHEGQQRFDQHVDKLTNYIRFWQAAGESEKTSIRTKDRLSQIVREGRYRGGTPPYGYKLVRRGRTNKRGHDVYEIEVDEQESAIVQTIFDLYLVKGYGSHRLANYLFDHGMLNRKGNNFTNTTVNNMLRNRSYTGVMKSGDTITDVFPHLQIITPEIFEATQSLMEQRTATHQTQRRVPLNTKGSSLLSGNVFCGHCGARLIVTTNGKRYTRKDGEVAITRRTRYVCYNKTRHKHLCDGQTGYTTRKLDRVIDEVIKNLFARINDLPKEALVEERYSAQISENRVALAQAKAVLQAHTAEVLEYEAEVIKVIRGESNLSSNLLNKLHEEARAKAEESEQRVLQIEESLHDGEKMKASLCEQFKNIRSWSDMYDTCDMETKKMILSRMFSDVRVSRDYKVDIDLTVDCEQLGITLDEVVADETVPAMNESV
ncbi:MAG: recombinase family protein, partial [Coriobacteriales bacterium]|jgi:hypothetical protein|nr:recombinase family protein [Coriobacteriales bacterium]